MRTPSQSQYPVLDNRPIDQWKVTELKEELKRRRLTTKGLKDDLIRRLDEALRVEQEEAVDEEVENGVDEPQVEAAPEAQVEAAPEANEEGEKSFSISFESEVPAPEFAGQFVVDDGSDGSMAEAVPVQAAVFMGSFGQQNEGINVTYSSEPPIGESVVEDVSKQPSEEKIQEEIGSGLFNDQALELGTIDAMDVSSFEMAGNVSESLPSDNAITDQGLQDDIMGRGSLESVAQQESEDIKTQHVDEKLDSSDPIANQVSEVSTNLGFPVKSNSVSTDSVSINEKNELEDNMITDNLKLEPDVKPEMVHPSSSNILPDDGKSHPTDVEEPLENKVSVQETDNDVSNADMSQKNHSTDLGSSEKLNLDRSSGEDSMEEDAMDSKQNDSIINSDEVGEKTEKSEETPMKGSPLASMETDVPSGGKGTQTESNDVVAASLEKRKLPDQEGVTSEPSKRQRRWKTETNKVREAQVSNNTAPAVAKDVMPPAVLRRNLSGSNSAGAVETPKEREVPPSTKASTNSLRIDRFLRPFTLKNVQDLLAKTGTVTSFWMDQIKTHCYVTYSSVDEALATRNALYNLQWPPNGGRNLIAEFVEPEEVKMKLEPPPPAPAAPVTAARAKVSEPATQPQPSPRQRNLRQQVPLQDLPPPPPLSTPPAGREWVHAPPPPVQEKVEAPIMTLDDLFRKTKATPRIYYLPLTEEQAAAKRKNVRQ